MGGLSTVEGSSPYSGWNPSLGTTAPVNPADTSPYSGYNPANPSAPPGGPGPVTPTAAPTPTTGGPARPTSSPAGATDPNAGLMPANPDPSVWGHGAFNYWTLAELGTEQVLGGRQAGGYAAALDKATAPALQGYAGFLKEMTSADPGARMAAAGPGVTAITKQQEAARKDIAANVPRGGAADYLTGMSYIQQASDIGNLIDQAWLSAEQQQGQFGEWGVGATERALALKQSGLASGAVTVGEAVGMKRATQAANQDAAAQLVAELAMLAFM